MSATCRLRSCDGVQVVFVVLQLDILLYGGDGGGDLRPEFVPPDKWFIAAEFHPNANASVRSFL